MRRFFTCVGLWLVMSMPLAHAADGLKRIESRHSVVDTVDRLEKVLLQKQFTIFARIDHAAGAERVEMELLPSQLVLFGKPEAGTHLMQSASTAGIDLPMKYLVSEAVDGAVYVEWNDPSWIAGRHDINDKDRVIEKMSNALESIATAAAM